MSTAETTNEATEQKAWNKPQIEEALAHLESLQVQLDALRYALPDLIQPLITANPSGGKSQLFSSVHKAAIDTTSAVKTFRQDWTAEQTQSILTKAEQSLASNADLSRATEVPAWGWNKDST